MTFDPNGGTPPDGTPPPEGTPPEETPPEETPSDPPEETPPDLDESPDPIAGADTEIDWEAFRRGDPREFEKILDRVSPLIANIAASYTDTPDDQEDPCQEICIRMWEQRNLYEDRGLLNGWVAKLAHRHARNWRANMESQNGTTARHSVGHVPREHMGTLLSDPWRLLIYRRFLGALYSALAELPPRRLEAYELVVLEENSPKQVARQLGVSTTTVRSHVRHVRATLRKLLKDCKDDLS